jgi:hypothetical protein
MKNINYRSFLFTGHVNDKKNLAFFVARMKQINNDSRTSKFPHMASRGV